MNQPSLGVWLLIVAGFAVVVLVVALAFNGVSQEYWGVVNVNSGTDVTPDQSSDTLTVDGSQGIMVVGDAGTDSLTIGLPTPASCPATGSGHAVNVFWDADTELYSFSC